MAGGATVFGRATTQNIAQNVLSNQTLNATPSPTDPLQMPNDALSKGYARLLYAAYDVKKHEIRPEDLAQVEQCIQFAERRFTELHGEEPQAVPPGPAPAPGAPGTNALAGAAPPQPPPGLAALMQPQAPAPAGPPITGAPAA